MKAAWTATLAAGAMLLALAAPASGAIVINEVESDGAADFIELYNTGAGAVDIGGYVVKDDNNANSDTIAGGTMLAAGAHRAVLTTFGLGSGDQARLFAPGDLVTPIDSYTWTSHAAATYGRCPDGTGAFTGTNAPTPDAANDCPVVASPWPGSGTIGLASAAGVFGSNLSGLVYQASGTSAPGVLWAVRNGPSELYRLVWDGTKWVPDPANGWGAGKTLVFPAGGGIPDAEGVTVAAGDANGVYVSIERDDSVGGTSRPGVLRYDVTAAGTTLTATREWNLTANLPGLPANGGLEAITWVPDDVLVAKGLIDEVTGVAYDPAAYPGHGAGLFLVGVEETGQVVAYALDQGAATFTRIAAFPSGFPKIMALDFEAETGLLWAVCDDSCSGRHATLDIAQTGPSDGKYVVKSTYERPAGMANLNNEGFAITPRAECASGLKPVYWADDSNTGGNALRSGTLGCVDPPAGSTPPADTPPVTPPATPPATPPSNPPATPRDTTRPSLSRVSATRRSVAFRLSEAARVTVTIERRAGRRFRRV